MEIIPGYTDLRIKANDLNEQGQRELEWYAEHNSIIQFSFALPNGERATARARLVKMPPDESGSLWYQLEPVNT